VSKGLMKNRNPNTRISGTDLPDFSDDPLLARAVQERLSLMRTQYSKHLRSVLREARELRRQLVEEAAVSVRHRAN
jgi:hypothetical protein